MAFNTVQQEARAPKHKKLLGVLFLRGIETELVFNPNRKDGLHDGIDFESINGPGHYT